jgi:hypothetical protein
MNYMICFVLALKIKVKKLDENPKSISIFFFLLVGNNARWG